MKHGEIRGRVFPRSTQHHSPLYTLVNSSIVPAQNRQWTLCPRWYMVFVSVWENRIHTLWTKGDVR